MALQIQVHVKVPKLPLGIKYKQGVLDESARAWLAYKPLPRGIKVWALQWRDGSNKPWSEKEVRAGAIESAREAFSRISNWSATTAVGSTEG